MAHLLLGAVDKLKAYRFRAKQSAGFRQLIFARRIYYFYDHPAPAPGGHKNNLLRAEESTDELRAFSAHAAGTLVISRPSYKPAVRPPLSAPIACFPGGNTEHASGPLPL